MKTFTLAAILLVAGLAIGCGSGSNNSGNINGNWTAALTDTNGTEALGFATAFVVNGDNTLSVGNFSLSTNSSCFVSGTTETGTFLLSGNFSGNVTGKFQLTVKSGNPSGNDLTLSGTANGNTISGTWTLVGGASCTGNGHFTMSKM